MINLSSAQEIKSEFLKGKWVLIQKKNSLDKIDFKLSENDKKTSDKENSQFETSLIFKENNSLILNQVGQEYQTHFKLKDSILILGNRTYYIIKIDDEKMHLRDDSELMPSEYLYKKKSLN